MKYSTYPEYESFTSEWLNECPKGWRNAAIKHCYRIQLGKMLKNRSESSEDIEVDYLKALHVNWTKVNVNNLPQMWASVNDLEKYSVENGDLLVCEGGEVGRATILTGIKNKTIIQNALHRARNDQLGEICYLNYVLRHLANIGWFEILCNKATIAHLTSEKLGAIKIPMPSVKEQQKIATFLDYKTQQIDQLIEKKKALIEKLNEQRIAVITQAVTKGIDKNVKMKASGVDWLGDVPEHWEVRRLKFMASIQNGKDYKDIETEEDGYPVYGSGGAFRKATKYLYDGESVLFGRKGTIDKPLYVNEKFWTVDTMFYSEIKRDINATFLFYSALTFQYKLLATQTALPSITQKDLENYLLCCPTLDEQIHVTKYLKNELKKTDKMITLSKQTIKYYEEYRISLIASAVIGKIDIRKFEVIKEIS